MLPTSIPAHIRAETIAGHEMAIDKLVKHIDELMPKHGIGNAVVNHQINQNLVCYRILVQELKEMKDEN